MAKKLKASEVPNDVLVCPNRGAVARYPWDDWFDGNWWLLIQGEDYLGKTIPFQNYARNVGRKRGLRVSIRNADGGRMYLKASKDT